MSSSESDPSSERVHSGIRPVGQDLDLEALQLGKYRILGEVGRGGMADVFLAVAQGFSGFNKLVVLKVIRSEVADDPDARNMFVDEARLAGRLNHPNVVHTLEVGEESGRPILVMEYLDGQALHSIFRRCRRDQKTMPLSLGLRILVEALQGLHYAHSLKDFDGSPLHLVHRDVSPQNIFVTYDGQVKMLDFGIAKAAISSSETRAGMMKGKASYMSPEQVSGEAVDHRADVFSAGVVLWQLLTGTQWWKGRPQGQILLTVLNGEIPKPSEVAENVPPALESICMRALEVKPEDRYQTALEMLEAIEDALEQRGDCSVKEVGAFVSNLFFRDREMLGRTLENELMTLSESGSNRRPVRDIVDPTLSLASVDTDTGMLDSVRGSEGEGPRRVLAIAIAALLLAALAVGGWGALRARAVPVAPAETAAVASAASPATLAPAAVLSVSPVASCRFEITATPASAAIFLDGERLASNPAAVSVPRDGKVHSVRAEATGHSPHTVEIAADRDAVFAMKLDRTSTGVAAGKQSAAKVASPGEVPPAVPPTAEPPPDPKTARERIKDLDTSSPW